MLFRKSKIISGIKFDEKLYIENAIDALEQSSTNPYAASIPLIASAELGDESRYQAARKKMFDTLTSLDNNPKPFPQWMRNNSFKAWMGDEELGEEINDSLLTSIDNAKQNNQQAEYILALLDRQIAMSEKPEIPIKTQQMSI